jgi:hypothetical protein
MIEKVWENQKYFNTFIAIYFLSLAFLLTTTPLSPSEAKIFYSKPDTPANIIAHLFYSFIPDVLSLRLLSFIFGVINIYLFYQIAKDYFDKKEDARASLFIFMLTPAVLVSNIILNEAIVPTTMTLLFLIAYRRRMILVQILAMGIIFWSDTATFAFYFAIAVYGYFKDEKYLLYLGLVFMILALIFGEYSFVGKPEGHLPELLGVYAGLFSPFLFIFYFYGLYRTALEGERDIVWYISFIPLIISILLSIRQQILIVDFAPYLLVGLMIPIKIYFRSLRVRLKRFRKPYILLSRVIIGVMIFSALILILHKPIYRGLGSPKRFFIAPLYYPFDIAQELKAKKEECFDSNIRSKYKIVLKFYGFKECPKPLFNGR